MARPTKAEPDQPSVPPALPELDPTFAFVCRKIVKIADNSPIILALRENGKLDFDILLLTPEEEIKSYGYTPIGDEAQMPLMLAHSGTIMMIRKWSLNLAMERG